MRRSNLRSIGDELDDGSPGGGRRVDGHVDKPSMPRQMASTRLYVGRARGACNDVADVGPAPDTTRCDDAAGSGRPGSRRTYLWSRRPTIILILASIFLVRPAAHQPVSSTANWPSGNCGWFGGPLDRSAASVLGHATALHRARIHRQHLGRCHYLEHATIHEELYWTG